MRGGVVFCVVEVGFWGEVLLFCFFAFLFGFKVLRVRRLKGWGFGWLEGWRVWRLEVSFFDGLEVFLW